MTENQMDSALEVAIQIADSGDEVISEHDLRRAIAALGLAVQRQSMPKRLAWAQRTDRPGWFWREDERVECTRLVTPWREVSRQP